MSTNAVEGTGNVGEMVPRRAGHRWWAWLRLVLLGIVLAGVGYGWLFATSAIVNLVALAAMRWWVREPRWVAGR